MKKKYEAPKAEKLEFDYSDTVVASGGQGGITYNNDPNGQYYKCTGESYYSAGWGEGC